MKELSRQTKDYILNQDVLLNKKLGYTANNLQGFIHILNMTGKVEVGWRESCSNTDKTIYTKRAWDKIVKRLFKDGIILHQERVKHGNSYATLSDGFWNSTIYSIS